MPVAITTGGKVGLAAVAGLLIVFALFSSFYFPRRNPDFPGNRLGLFILVAALLFAGTMAGVVVFAKESEEEHAPPETVGDPKAGEAVFASAGCVGCHTLKAAGASGAVGPNLDESKPDAALVVERVTKGSGVMPAFGGQLDEKQIQDVAAYVVASTQG